MTGRAEAAPPSLDWDDVRVFLEAAESRSLSEAARRLGVGQATASRRVARLEERLGYPLFTRSVEGIEMTAQGRRLLQAARAMHDGALAVERAARGLSDELSGRVRLTAPPGVSVDMLGPFAVALAERHPSLRLEVLASLAHLDLSRGEADLAIRTSEPREPELLAIARVRVRLGAYVSTKHCDSLEEPSSLSELRWVGWSPRLAGVPPEGWLRRQLADFEPVFTADDFLVLQSAVAAGLGAILLPDAQASFWPNLRRVTLVSHEEDKLPMGTVYLVASRAGWVSPRIRAVADFLVEWMSPLPGVSIEAASPRLA